MLCINNLVVSNKKIDKGKQCKSFLMLLVQYLRGKFEERITLFTLIYFLITDNKIIDTKHFY